MHATQPPPFWTAVDKIWAAPFAAFLAKSPKLGEVVPLMDLSASAGSSDRQRWSTDNVPLTSLSVSSLARSLDPRWLVGKWKCWADRRAFLPLSRHPLPAWGTKYPLKWEAKLSDSDILQSSESAQNLVLGCPHSANSCD